MFDSCTFLDTTRLPCISYLPGGFCSRPDMFRCPEYIRTHMPSLSFSSMKDFSHCHRKFYHGYIQGIELKEKKKALELGSKASLILGMLHAVTNPDGVGEYKRFIRSAWESTLEPGDPDSFGDLSLIIMKAMFDAYVACGLHEHKGTSEYEFRWKDLDYPEIHGFLDLAIQEQAWAEEFKYTTSPQYYDKFAMEEQLSSYFIGAPQINTFRVTCLVPPKFRPKDNEKLSQFYKRVYDDIVSRNTTAYFMQTTYYRSEFNLDQFKHKARMIAEEIMQYCNKAQLTPDPTYYFYQNKQACHAPFECEFIDICTSGVMPDNLFKKRGKR